MAAAGGGTVLTADDVIELCRAHGLCARVLGIQRLTAPPTADTERTSEASQELPAWELVPMDPPEGR